MSELSADRILDRVAQPPSSRFNRTVPYRYAGFSLASNPNLPPVPEGDDDQFYAIGYGDMFRPDLVAHKFYGDSDLWWFVVLVNEDQLKADGKLNFLEKFLPGVTLRIPPQQVALSYVNGRA